MENHEACSTGSTPFPEVNVTTYTTQGCGRGHGCGSGRGCSSHFGNHGGYFKNPSRHLKWERNEKKIEKDKGDSNKNLEESSCYRCGMKIHWSHAYRMPKHNLGPRLKRRKLDSTASVCSLTLFLFQVFW